MLLQPPDGVSPEQQAAAEALVAAALGASSLSERQVSQTGIVTGGVIPLRDGPLTALTSFSLNGYDLMPTASPWFVRVPVGMAPYGLVSYAPYSGMYALTYTAGWTADNVPDAVQAAVKAVAVNLSSAGDTAGLTEYRLGDVTEKYAGNAALTGLPPGVLALLGAYRPLRF